MPHKHYEGMDEGHPKPMGKMPMKRSGKKMAMHEKVGFPSAQLPGKTQPRDRSGGTPRCRTCPDSKGM